MNELDKLQDAFLKADAAGNKADAKLFADEIKRLSAEQEMTQYGQDQFNATQEQTSGQPAQQGEITDPLHYNRSGDGNFQGSFLGSMVQGGRDILDAGAQGLYHALPESVQQAGDKFNNMLADPNLPTSALVGEMPEGGIDQKLQQDEAAFQQQRANAGRGGIDAGRIVGNIAATLPLVSARGLQFANDAKGLGGFLANMGRGGAQGAIAGAAQPVLDGDFVQSKLGQAGYGAMFGAGAYPLGSALGRVISPKVDKQTKHLLDEGVNPTAGDILGGGFKTAEDKLMSVPIVGDAIRNARLKAREEFNRAAMSRALRGTGQKVDDIPLGQEGTNKIYQVLDNEYDKLYTKVKFKQDNKFKDAIAKISDEAKTLDEPQAKKFREIVGEFVENKLNPDGGMDGKTFKKLQTKLRQEGSRFAKNQDPFNQDLGILINKVNDAASNALKRTNPEHSAKISQLQRNYANYIRLEKATSTTADVSGGFSPSQLSMAVKSTDQSLRKGQFGRGQSLMQDLSSSGMKVLNPKIPDSGTTGRALSALLGAGTLYGGMTNPLLTGLALGGVGATALPAVGRKTMAALLAKRPKGAKEFAHELTKISPVIGATSAPALQ